MYQLLAPLPDRDYIVRWTDLIFTVMYFKSVKETEDEFQELMKENSLKPYT